jgi:probable HAF family extracellular repeat protein
VTLNITILTPTVIYQSADYRLTDQGSGAPLPAPSTKRVTLTYQEWTGFVTYAGIGRMNGRETADVVRGWLEGKPSLTFEEVAETLRVRGTEWLRPLPLARRRHTFILAGVVNKAPMAAVVSNYQRWHGQVAGAVAPELIVTIVRARAKAEVIVAGVGVAVSGRDRRALARLAEAHPGDSLRIRRAMAEANTRAALSGAGLISEDCLVYSQDIDGHGQEETTGSSRSELKGLTNGVDMTAMIRPLLDQHFGPGLWTLVGSTSATSAPSSPPPPCKLQLVNPTEGDGYEIRELAMPDGRRATPRSINAAGVAVGDGTPIWGGPSFPCIWRTPSELQFLPHLGGLGGMAADVNDAGIVVGTSETPDRASHACIWNPEGELQDIGYALGRLSGARAINSAGWIAGWASIHPTEGGQAHFRPVWWVNGGNPRLVRELGGRWGEAVDVSDEDHVLMFANDGRDSVSWLSEGGEPFEIANPEGCRSCWPLVLTSDRRIIGTTIDGTYRRGVAVRYPDGTWVQLKMPADSELTAAGNDGSLAGYQLISGYRVPWIWPAGASEARPLPQFRHHHHTPTAVAANGWVAGTANADNCSHPLLWRPLAIQARGT